MVACRLPIFLLFENDGMGAPYFLPFENDDTWDDEVGAPYFLPFENDDTWDDEVGAPYFLPFENNESAASKLPPTKQSNTRKYHHRGDDAAFAGGLLEIIRADEGGDDD